jgi:hypothetical protein
MPNSVRNYLNGLFSLNTSWKTSSIKNNNKDDAFLDLNVNEICEVFADLRCISTRLFLKSFLGGETI